MAIRLTEERLDATRVRATTRDMLPASEVRAVLSHLDAVEGELAALKAEHADAEFWRKAFERLRDDTGRETRGRLDRVTSGALR